MQPIRIDVQILTQPARRSSPCNVDVRLTNQNARPVLINGRMAVGYRDSQARELFAEVFRPGSDEVISNRTQLYKRDFSPPEDYIWLVPGQTVSTSFDLFAWYSLPSAGDYELAVVYQADEPLGAKAEGLLTGAYSSDRTAFTVAP